MSDDLIRRSDAIKVAKEFWYKPDIAGALAELPTIEPKHGEWEEKETFHNADDNPIIEEWQSARCSVCHKYHTTPYMYYFSDYNFCPNCGAKMVAKDTNAPNMKGEDDE